MSRAVGVALLAVALGAGHSPAAPSDIDRYVARRAACDHFRGEEPYDAARAAFLASRIRATCANIDAQRAALRRKYRHDPRALARLPQP
jgi:hypothetical protein